MIEYLSTWIEQIIIALIVASIFEMILPNGNIKKYVKMVLSIYVIFNIISPFVNTDKLYSLASKEVDSYIGNITESKSSSNQISNDSAYKKLYIQELEKNLEDRIKEYGYYTKECEIEAVLDKDAFNAGINRITLVISKNNTSVKEVNQIQKVEINKNEEIIETNANVKNSEEVKKMKKELSEIYEIDESIIYITEE